VQDGFFGDTLSDHHLEVGLVWDTLTSCQLFESEEVKARDGQGDTIIFISDELDRFETVSLEREGSFLPLSDHIHTPILFIHSCEGS
jgi:hypothetical protein